MIFQFTLFPLLALETRLKIIRFAANELSPQNSRIIRAEYADDIEFPLVRCELPVVDARHLHEQCPHLERIILVLKTKLNFNESKSTVKYLPYAKSGKKGREISDDDIKFVFPNLDKVRRQGWNPKVQFMTKLVSGPLESIYRSWKLVVPRHRRLWIDKAIYGVSPDLWSRYWNLRLSLKGYTADVM
jgi:hypothetical protein